MHVTSGIWQFKPSEDFAKAIAQELENRGLFRETFFAYRTSEADLVMRGRLVSTQYKAKMYSYGLSVYGPALWFIGFPAGSYGNDLQVELSLQERGSGKVLWTGRFSGDKGSVFWLYRMPSDFQYDELIKRGLSEAIDDLEKTLNSRAE